MLGKKIKAYLDATHRKYSLVCDALGVSPAIATSILNGSRPLSAEEYFKICDALEISLDYFRDVAS